MKKHIVIQKKEFDCFDVYFSAEGHSFVYAVFKDKDSYIEGLVEYIFKEENLLNYAKRNNKIGFIGTQKQYAKLYNNISMFLNTDIELLEVDNITDELKDVLGQEYTLIDEAGNLKVQNDKVGKIGEYTFHLLLNNYFKLNCILPKFRCTTNRNMSVFGIDTLFLDTSKKVLYFGESKFCKTLDNGIKLINCSLEKYEEQIDEEYRIVLSDDEAFRLSEEFENIFGNAKQICISFREFIKIAGIKEIGVPVFIAHGNMEIENVNPEEYINKLVKKIKRNKYFGIDVKYIFISLPVIDKNKFIERAIIKAVKKQDEYKNKISRNCGYSTV
ncbi:MAG: DUF1837 domain-containing protein [Lachnospiraceae bacterium]|nr:DUF1837 domain-containing protein [Lachnospiraceae bacterium]